MAKTVDEVIVAPLAQPLGLQRREAPVLPLGEERVRRRTGRGLLGEEVALLPDVEGAAVNAERQVEIETRGAPARLLRHGAQLLRRGPLRPEVVAMILVVIVGRGESPLPQPLGPRLPGLAPAVAHGAEGSVGFE